MANQDELFTRRFGGGKRTYYLDVKRDANGESYVVISESTRKGVDKKMRNRVMVWKEDFEDLFQCMCEMQDYLKNGQNGSADAVGVGAARTGFHIDSANA